MKRNQIVILGTAGIILILIGWAAYSASKQGAAPTTDGLGTETATTTDGAVQGGAGGATAKMTTPKTTASNSAASQKSARFEGYDSYDIKLDPVIAKVYGDSVLTLFGLRGTVRTQLAYVREFVRPSNSTWFIYYGTKPETDAGSGPYFAYNSAKNQLKVLERFGNYADTWLADENRVSADGHTYASVYAYDTKNERTLNAVDLPSEVVTTVKILPSYETFVESFNAFGGGPVSYVWWKDADTIEVKVFDSTKEISTAQGKVHPYLRTERVDYVRGN